MAYGLWGKAPQGVEALREVEVQGRERTATVKTGAGGRALAGEKRGAAGLRANRARVPAAGLEDVMRARALS